MTNDWLRMKVWPIVATHVIVLPKPPPSNESFWRLLTVASITPIFPRSDDRGCGSS